MRPVPRFALCPLCAAALLTLAGCGAKEEPPGPGVSGVSGVSADPAGETDGTGPETSTAPAGVPVTITLTDGVVTVNGVTIDRDAEGNGIELLVEALGEPDRTSSRGPDVMTWDDEGVYARGRRSALRGIGVLLAPGPFPLPFHPKTTFSGTWTVDGVPVERSIGEETTDALEASGAVPMFVDGISGEDPAARSGVLAIVEYEGF